MCQSLHLSLTNHVHQYWWRRPRHPLVTAATRRPSYRGSPVDLVVDVRTNVEFWLGHISGAVCIPADRLPGALDGRPGVSLKSRILVYCASGARSAAAATRLRSAGYTNVVDAGGIGAAREHITP